ncbi:MAG: AMP-binding protein [Parahaliea sp.]
MTEPLVRCGELTRTLREASERAARLASGLRELGLAHNERCAIMMRNEPSFIEASLAATLLGAAPVPINWHWTGSDLGHLLRDSGAKVVIVHTDLLGAVEAQAPAGTVIVEAGVPEPVVESYRLSRVPLTPTGRHASLEALIAQNDPVTQANTTPSIGVIYTSGTTGLPKGVLRDPIAPENVDRILDTMRGLLKINSGTRILLPAPLYHAAPNANAMFAVALGADLTIMPKFEAEEFLRLVQDLRIESVQMVPTMFHRLLQLPRETRDAYNLSSLKAVVHAAAPCPAKTKQAMIDWFGPIIHEYYGGTETSILVSCDSTEALAHPGTVGKPVFGPTFAFSTRMARCFR